MGDDRPSVYREGDVWVIRASALGGCMKALIAAGRGVEAAATPDWMQEKFDQGHAGEDIIRQWYQTQARTITPWSGLGTKTYPDADQVAFDYRLTDNIIIRGHLDDLGAEYKLLAPSTYSKATGSEGINVIGTYPWQLSIYMMAFNAEWWDWVCVEKDEEGLPNLERTHIGRFHKPPRSAAEIYERAVTVIDWVEHREYDEYPPCDVKQYPCPYYLLEDDDDDIPTLTVDESNTLKWIREAIDRAALMELDAKALKAAAQQDLKTLLTDRKTVLSTDGTKVTWVRTEHPEKLVTPKPYTKKAYVTEYPKITPPSSQGEDK